MEPPTPVAADVAPTLCHPLNGSIQAQMHGGVSTFLCTPVEQLRQLEQSADAQAPLPLVLQTPFPVARVSASYPRLPQ